MISSRPAALLAVRDIDAAEFAPTPATPEAWAYERLRQSPADGDELAAIAAAAGVDGLARWMLWSSRALRRGQLVYRVMDAGGATLADVLPLRADAPDLTRALPVPTGPLRLSRFATLRRRGDALVLEMPFATARAELQARAVALIAIADGTRTLEEIAADEADPAAARTLLAVLADCGFLVEIDADGRAAEDRDLVRSQWESHDLVLHARTRTARAGEHRGGTFRFVPERAAPPALRHPVGTPAIALARPDLDRLIVTDVPFASVMEARASRRRFGRLDAGQLGEFLYRTVRVRAQIPAGTDPRGYARTDRPHPGGGGMHELTTYLGIADCEGIAAGLYRYDPVAHGLDLVAAPGPAIDRLLDDARAASAAEDRPPVLVLLAADFSRLSWKYEGIAYATTLKNVGVLFATMQLVATAMGLGSCPLGGGDSETFAAATGLDPLEETTVGELMLGA